MKNPTSFDYLTNRAFSDIESQTKMKIHRLWIVTLLIVGSSPFLLAHSPAGFGLLNPLVPVSVITGHSGLLSAGLTGAALLKLKAAAGIAYWLSIRKHKRQKGWGWNGRRKRDADVETQEKRIRNIETVPADAGMNEFNPSLDEILQYDRLGCGMRLVCELSATPNAVLMDDEKLILGIFGRDRDGKVKNEGRKSRGELSYDYAAMLGSHSKDTKICSKVYGRCPYSAPEIMFSLRDIK